MTSSAPYVSFCVHSRNDNHGGDMYRRMKACLMGFFDQAERHELRSEIVLVDWNPPKEKPLLKDAYRWLKDSKFCTVRVILVPPSIHQRYEGWQKIGINNTVAHNVGIRRAHGQFILSATIDLLLSNGLVEFIASEKLDENCLYRIDRSNVKRGVTRLQSLDEQLAYCEKNVFHVFQFDPTRSRLSNNEADNLNPFPNLIDYPALYTGGPGDFMLMAKKHWDNLRSFPEADLIDAGLDILFAYMIYISGVKVESLSDVGRLYHIDHDVRFYSREANFLAKTGLKNILPESVMQTFKSVVRCFLRPKTQLDELNVKTMTWMEMEKIILEMASGKRSLIVNDESWGLGGEKFQEDVVTQAETHKLSAAV